MEIPLFEEASLIEIPSKYEKLNERSKYRKTIIDFLGEEFRAGKIVCEFISEAQIMSNSLKRWCKPDDHVKIFSRRNIVYLVKEQII